MKYNLSFDGGKPAEFMQWRDDCSENPTGVNQHGTWYEERNGWCPGAVHSGIYVDITDSLNLTATTHNVSLDLSVLSRHTSQYELYTNLGGWLKNDRAILTIDLKAFVYPAAAVQAIQNSGKKCSKIHSAIQGKSMDAVGARWPGPKWHEYTPKHSKTKNFLKGHDSMTNGVESHKQECIDFEATAPWYLFNSKSDEGEHNALASSPHITWLNVFTNRLIQGNSQVQKISINRTKFPKQWGQVGLRLRLQKPGGGLDYDHWDRIASIGLIVDRPPMPVPVTEKAPQQSQFQPLFSVSMIPLLILTMGVCAHMSFLYKSLPRKGQEEPKDAVPFYGSVGS
jgi:hypothetical protein